MKKKLIALSLLSLLSVLTSSLKRFVLVLSCLASVTMVKASALPLVPVGLKPGDHYYLQFVTTGIRDATSTNIADYDNFVRAQAELPGALTKGWGVNWKAIAGTSYDPAKLHVAFTNAPIYRIDGAMILANASNLWTSTPISGPTGYLSNAPSIDQFGQNTGYLVWTGCNWTGFGIGLGTFGQALFGYALGKDSTWIDFADQAQGPVSTTNLYSLYGVSPELVVPTPSLSMFLSSSNTAVVFWPNSGSYTLQQNSNLALSAGWATSGYPVTTNSPFGTNSITIISPTGNLFFRLSSP